MGRRGYPPEFRRKVLDLVEAGRSVADVARDLEISDQSIYTWRRQDRIDRGLVPGLTVARRPNSPRPSAASPSWRPSCARCARAMELVREPEPPGIPGRFRCLPGAWCHSRHGLRTVKCEGEVGCGSWRGSTVRRQSAAITWWPLLPGRRSRSRARARHHRQALTGPDSVGRARIGSAAQNRLASACLSQTTRFGRISLGVDHPHEACGVWTPGEPVANLVCYGLDALPAPRPRVGRHGRRLRSRLRGDGAGEAGVRRGAAGHPPGGTWPSATATTPPRATRAGRTPSRCSRPTPTAAGSRPPTTAT
jgi:transposase